MDKAEALEFIGLKEPYSDEALRNRYTERYNYFQMLYANAPSKVIEKIQQQNIEKLNQVKRMLLEELAVRKANLERKPSKPSGRVKPIPLQPEGKPVVAWLIVHTENKKAETFDLYEGINYIGRKKKDDTANNIMIKDDPFVSRTHAFIKCKEVNGVLQFDLYDGDGSKPSANGVFLNGYETRVKQHCPLAENDTIQIGTTKLVFKIRKDHRSRTGELEDVLRTDFIRTIDINK